MHRNTSPFRYLPWLARDVARGPGLLYLVISITLTIVFWRIKQRTGMAPEPGDILQQIFARVTLIAVLIATGGMVNTDVSQGFYRAWFSKPMAPWWYYLQRWLLGGVAVLLIPVVFGSLLALMLGGSPGITFELMAGLGLGYLLIGGAVFLVSSIGRFDWLFIFLLATAQGGLAATRRLAMELPTALEWISRVLPPFHLIDPGAPLLSGRPLLHVLGYGTAMVLTALLILTYRPLGSGGRA
jgi:hypothetical protein